MNKFSRVTRTLVALFVCFAMTLSFAACEKKDKNAEFAMELSSNEVSKDKSVTVFGIVTGTEDTTYTVVVKNAEGSDGADYVNVTKNDTTYTISVTKNVSEDKKLIVEGYPNANKDLVVKKDLTVKANVAGSTSITAMAVSAKNSARKTYMRKGDDIELSVVVSTSEADKSYKVEVENPASKPNLVSVVDGKIIVNEDVTKNETVNIIVTANANPSAKSTIKLVIKPPKTGDSVGDLTQEIIDKIGNLKLEVSGVLSDITVNSGAESRTDYDYKVYLSAEAEKDDEQEGLFNSYVFSNAEWHGQWSYRSNPDNVMSETYKRGDDANTEKVYINKDNKLTSETVTDSYSNLLSWESQRYWNHLGYLDLANFEQDVENPNLYIYEMEYGTIDTDIIMGNTTYTPTEDEYLMRYFAQSLTPILDQQFYTFSILLDDNHNVEKLIGETYPNDIYSYDDEGQADEKIGYSYTLVEMTIDAYGNDVHMPEVTPYEAPTTGMAAIRFGYLKSALDKLNAANTKNYTFKMTETAEVTPSYDPNDYTVSGSEGVSAPTTSASGVWDGKVHTTSFTSDTGEVGYRGIVTEDGVLINSTMEYSNGGYRTDAYGYKQNSDNTYDVFECVSGKLVGKSKRNGNISERLPSFTVSPYIFKYAGSTPYKQNSDSEFVYSYALIDSVIIQSVAEEFCIKDYARYATGSVTRAFNVNVYVNEKTEECRLIGVSFAYNIIDTYLGYYHTEYSNFGSSVLPDDMFSASNYTPRVVPTKWNDFADCEYLPTATSKSGSGEAMKAGDLMNKVFGAGAADKIPSPSVFSSVFSDNYSKTIWHNYFNTGNKTADGDEYKPTVNFNMWVDDMLLDGNNALSLAKYNEIIDKLSTEFAKYGFKDYAAGTYLREGTQSKTRMKSYINENAGSKGIVIRIENIGYKTFYINFYNAGDWNPKK